MLYEIFTTLLIILETIIVIDLIGIAVLEIIEVVNERR